MKPIHIGTSPITNRIYVGHVLKSGLGWAANKQHGCGAASKQSEHLRQQWLKCWPTSPRKRLRLSGCGLMLRGNSSARHNLAMMNFYRAVSRHEARS